MHEKFQRMAPDGAVGVVQQGRRLQSFHCGMRLRYTQPNSLRKLRVWELLRCLIHKRGENNDILSFNHGAYYIRKSRINQIEHTSNH